MFQQPKSQTNTLSLAIVFAAVVVAGTMAWTRQTNPGVGAGTSAPPPVAQPAQAGPPIEGTEPLPTGHPAVGAAGTGAANVHAGGTEGLGGGLNAMEEEAVPPSIEWTVPTRWQLVPSESKMRVATYKIPRAAGDSEDAELSVIRAGGDMDSNIDRWIGQFDESGQQTAKRLDKTISGFKVAVIEIKGAYTGMGGAPHPGYAMLSAIVDTADMKHFFKMTGPEKTVLAARAEFDALVDSLKPRAKP